MSKCIAGASSSACRQCVQINCDPAFTTCSGLTPPKFEEPLAGACTDAVDESTWKTKGCKNFNSDMDKCGHQCLSSASCTASCMTKAEGYSQNCSNCMGALTSCTAKHCMAKCIRGQTPDCVKCVDANCTPAFKTCSGIIPPAQPDGSDCPKVEEPLGGACTDAVDQSTWATKGCQNFSSDMNN
eukprot:UN28270